MQRSELFHVCIVVPQIETAREHLAELLGVEWGPLRQFAFPYRRADGREAVVEDFTLCYSLAAPHLELVEGRPGTPWEYVFFVDVQGHTAAGPDSALGRALETLGERCSFTRVLGSYPEAENA